MKKFKYVGLIIAIAIIPFILSILFIPKDTGYIPVSVQDFEELPVAEVEKLPEEQKESEKASSFINTKLYRGLWFDIEYPANFTSSPALPLETFNDIKFVRTDEAYFSDPNNEVEFYVYSPSWRGEPDYLTIKPYEVLVSEESKQSKGDYGDTVIKWVTVKEDKGLYYRSYVYIRQQVGTESEVSHTFGIKYRDVGVYEKYRDAYIAFKDSLRQFID